MFCRGLIKSCRILSRNQSNVATKLVVLDVENKTGVAKLTLNRPPVNGLNLELLKAINDGIKEVEGNKCRGLILTSSSSSVFSAGLDILEMYQPDEKRLREFWTTLQEAWLTLYGTSVPTASFINGHSPAGGCLLAVSCEYRAMLPNFTIGLNETQLGITAPTWFMASLLNVLPRRVAESALTQGRMFTTEEAYHYGLIDSIVQNTDEGLNKCAEFFASFKKVHPMARAMTKRQFRQNDLNDLKKNRSQDLETFVRFALSDEVQKSLGVYLENLKKRKN